MEITKIDTHTIIVELWSLRLTAGCDQDVGFGHNIPEIYAQKKKKIYSVHNEKFNISDYNISLLSL